MKINLSWKTYAVLSIVSLGGIHAMEHVPAELTGVSEGYTRFYRSSTASVTLSGLVNVKWDNEQMTMPLFKWIGGEQAEELHFCVHIAHSSGRRLNSARTLGTVNSNMDQHWVEAYRSSGVTRCTIQDCHLFANDIPNFPDYIKIKLVPKT
uniref:AvrL567-E n=1 Tax=Melampsora lini TaxID=5261 RepID=Q1HBK5_MELLI|nr:AvrL567-E [Melampsora lini]